MINDIKHVLKTFLYTSCILLVFLRYTYTATVSAEKFDNCCPRQPIGSGADYLVYTYPPQHR